jgi:hypothetical protein
VGGLDLPVSLPIDSDLVLENSDSKQLPRNVDVILRALGYPPPRQAEPEVRA